MARGVTGALFGRLGWGKPSGDASASSPVPVHRLQPPVPVPLDPAEHARQFAAEWADRLEVYARRRMREVGVPEHLIGTVDLENRVERRAFFPHQSSGSRKIYRRGINIDSGILNPALLDELPDPEVRSEWAHARLLDRADAVIAHEFEEATGADPVDHPKAVRKAPDTRLGISEAARRILVAIAASHLS
jgi:hypothetical protein